MKTVFAACFVAIAGLAFAPHGQAETADETAEVMLMGTFHFSSPKADAVKTDSLDVMTDESQAYLEALSRRIARTFRPTRVLLEYAPENDALINERYRQYVSGDYELSVNEVYQLGFRIARDAGLERVDSFDHRDIPWEAEAMLAYAEEHDPDAHAAFYAEIERLTEIAQREQDTLSLAELLARSNDPAEHAANKALYVNTNAIGAGDGYAGADASASWWHRNFRMYANIQALAGPGERVFVLGGSGHIAILADLLALDDEREAVDVRGYLDSD